MKHTELEKDIARRSDKSERSSLQKQYEQALERIKSLERERHAILALKDSPQFVEIKDEATNRNTEAVAIVLASDWHIEETVNPATINNLNTYNLAIAEARAKEFFVNTLKLVRKEQQQAKIDTLVLALLGDFISGNIHEELLENCSLRPIEAIIRVQSWLVSGIQFLLTHSKLKLIIPCHSGNHTRITKTTHISTEKGNSLEYFMYHTMANLFRNEKRVKFVISEGYHSYLNFYQYRIRFHHGHQLRYGGGIGGIFIPAYKAISQWQKAKHADLDCFGHFHNMKDGGNFLLNGSLIGFNAFAVSIKADFEPPRQTFFLLSKKRGKSMVTPITFNQ